MSSKPSIHSPPPLDPGVLSKPRSRSFCSICLVWSSLVFGAALVFWLIVPMSTGLYKAISKLRDPHLNLLANASLVNDQVIRPLVNEEQTFDIAVSVWLRARTEEEKIWKDSFPLNFASEDSADERERRLGEEILEVPLYSDIAFRGLHLSDRHITADVNFRLPTGRFLDQNLTVADLRGSFVLIPSSPSPLDYLVNFSTSWPRSISRLPLRSWPFPLGSDDTSLARTLADEAVDSFGCSTPLVQFHEIHPRCAMSGSSALLDADISTVEDVVNEDEDDSDDQSKPERVLKTHDDDKLLSVPARKIKVADNDQGQPIYAYTVPHPHIVTRSQLRIVEESRPFNLKAYNKVHKQLQATYCRAAGSAYPSRKFCRRAYKSNGHWDTRMKLEIPQDDSDSGATVPRTEWVYSPFMSPRQGSAGHLDLIPVPVSRENCTIAGNDTIPAAILPKQYEEYMNITWRISFSGRTPGKLTLGDVLGGISAGGLFNQTEYEKQQGHSRSEILNGLAGHRFHEDAHPRRRAMIEIIPPTVMSFVHVLDIHYWYTRSSTRSISITGTILIAIGQLTHELIGLFSTFDDTKGWTLVKWGSMLPGLLLFPVAIAPYIYMMKVVLRVDWQWTRSNWNKQAPLRRLRPTHKERTSERLDRRTNGVIMIGVLLGLTAYYWFYPSGQMIIPPNTPAPSVEDTSLFQWRKASGGLLMSMQWVGYIYQILLNHRAQTFAGRHGSAQIIGLVCSVIELSVFIPGIVGRYDLRPGLSTTDVLYEGIVFILAWQAIWMRGVPRQAGEVDEDED